MDTPPPMDCKLPPLLRFRTLKASFSRATRTILASLPAVHIYRANPHDHRVGVEKSQAFEHSVKQAIIMVIQ
eukprot:1184232-Prorocentrum_minimum.AAC.1